MPDLRAKPRSFKLFKYFVILSLVAILAILSLVGLGLQGVLLRYVIVEAEKDATRLTDALRDLEMSFILDTDRSGQERLRIRQEDLPILDRDMRVFLAHFNIIKIKIFNDEQFIVYSTDLDIIGEHDPENVELEQALRGYITSEFTRDHVWDLDDEDRPDVNIVETYVPVFGTKGQIVGSFEIYKDVTGDLRAAQTTLLRSVSVVAMTLLAAFASLALLMHRATQTIESHETALLTNEARTRAVIEAAADGIVTVTPKGEIRSFNRAAGQIFGCSVEEASANAFTDYARLVHIGNDPDFMAYCCRQAESTESSERELEGRRRDGSVFPMGIAVNEAQIGDERLLTVMIRDLTKEKIAELDQREKDVKRADEMAMVALLATGVAHELRNPLTTVKLFFQNNQEQALSLGMSVDDLNVVEQEILRMERSLQTFLDFARPSQPTITHFDLSQEIDRILLLIEGRAAHQGVTCRKSVPAEGRWMVRGDRDQIQQILLNLALNALEAMPEGGELVFKLCPGDHGSIEIHVCDSGTGISESVLPRLFEPFVTSKDQGVGLGLVISRRIAEEHGGSLVAQNRTEGGACFIFRIPTPTNESPP